MKIREKNPNPSIWHVLCISRLPMFHVKDGPADVFRLWHLDWLSSLPSDFYCVVVGWTKFWIFSDIGEIIRKVQPKCSRAKSDRQCPEIFREYFLTISTVCGRILAENLKNGTFQQKKKGYALVFVSLSGGTSPERFWTILNDTWTILNNTWTILSDSERYHIWTILNDSTRYLNDTVQTICKNLVQNWIWGFNFAAPFWAKIQSFQAKLQSWPSFQKFYGRWVLAKHFWSRNWGQAPAAFLCSPVVLGGGKARLDPAAIQLFHAHARASW